MTQRVRRAERDDLRPKAGPAVRRFRRFRWRGVQREDYAPGVEQVSSGLSRQVLFAGSRGEEIDFDVRYFEVGAGKQTSFDRHEHAHVVIALRGRGSVRLGRRWLPLSRFDACYIGPYVAHRLRNDGRSPFGFLCLVDSVRDSSPLQVEGRWFACRSQAEK